MRAIHGTKPALVLGLALVVLLAMTATRAGAGA
jgi:hypothetical protein